MFYSVMHDDEIFVRNEFGNNLFVFRVYYAFLVIGWNPCLNMCVIWLRISNASWVANRFARCPLLS